MKDVFLLYFCSCRYDDKLKEARALGTKRALTVGFSLALIFFSRLSCDFCWILVNTITETFGGENIREFRSFVAIRESFSAKFGAWRPSAQQKRAIRESFSAKIVF